MKHRWFLGALLAILLFFMIRMAWLPTAAIRLAASAVAYPFLLMQNVVTTRLDHWRQHRATRQEMLEFIAHLRKQNKELLASNIALQGQLNFMRHIEELTEFKKRYASDNSLLAQVLVRTFHDQEHSFIVGRGSFHGVEPDMVAVWHHCLIGRVSDVYPFYSKVMLITDARCKIAAECQGSHAQGIIQGMYDLTYLALCYVDHLVPLELNELVISSGQGIIFPSGFSLGILKSYQSGQLYHTIVVKVPCDLTAIDYCYLIAKGHE
jgi:rod shape-determining protein MreC